MPETACVRFAEISDKDRVIALLKKVLKSGSMMDTADSDIIANSVAKQENGMQMPNGRNCGFSRFLMATPPSPLLIFASPHAMMKAEKARIRCARYGGFGVLDEINMAKMKRWRCYTPRWISDVRLTYRVMTDWISIRPRNSSAP